MRIVGFEHLHLHSHYSTLDGYGLPVEYANRWYQHGKYLCITDHGMMGAIPEQIKVCDAICDKYGKNRLSPLFGVELYCNRMHREATPTEDSRKQFMSRLDPDELKEFKTWGAHLLAIAYNFTGYQNLVRLSSWAFQNGFYARPRVNYEQLEKYKEGLIFTSCCYNSEVGRAFDKGGADAADAVIERYIRMFGKDNFYLEIMLLDFKKQKPYNIYVIGASERYGLNIICTQDCHYPNKEDSKYQRLMLMIQTGRTIGEIQQAMAEDSMQDFFELQDSNLWMKTEEELNEMWLEKYSDTIPLEIFEEAKLNTVRICERAKGIKLDRKNKLPVLDDADEKLKEAIFAGFNRRNLPKTRKYLDRIKEEYQIICRKGFASYFLIQKMMTDEARRYCKEEMGWCGWEAKGPARGSSGGALTSYCLGITDIDPIEEGLLFSRFLSEARGGKQMQLRFKNIDPD